MSKTANNTHRRAMRTVTPAVRAGRAAAGTVMAAGLLLGGAAAATAEPQNDAPQAPQAEGAAPAVLPPVTAPAVGIPAAESAEGDDEAESATADIADITVELPEPEPEPEPEPVDEESDEDAQSDEAQQDSEDEGDQQRESREDEDASRSNERSSREDSEDERSESEDDESQESSESSEEKSAPAPSAAKGSSVLATARSGIGTPYVYGGASPSGWDCSGFVQWVYAQHGVSLPHSAGGQASAGTVIPKSQAKPGDLVYKPGHIGIYAGGNTFVDAGNKRVDTSERNIYSGSWTYIRIG
ncbi:NlpC/P60 family protein [Brachybacterium sp. GCM10030252]|uniref:NlpC/P60 family protein n=1 Tax=Brachybacterium sp. GCM10030252 TaxID=3273380 RepID=UPI0036195A09